MAKKEMMYNRRSEGELERKDAVRHRNVRINWFVNSHWPEQRTHTARGDFSNEE